MVKISRKHCNWFLKLNDNKDKKTGLKNLVFDLSK